MMEKSAQPGEGLGGGVHAHPLSLYLPLYVYKDVVYALADRADTLPLFLLYIYMFSVFFYIKDSSKEDHVQKTRWSVFTLQSEN
jgi:hypothetical protein